MTGTPRRQATPHAGPELGWWRMLRLGLVGLASDVRDRHRNPRLRKPASRRGLDPRLRRPVFIVGAPRSGTTFLGSCVGRVPEVSYHFEPRLTKVAARCVHHGAWTERKAAAVFRASYSLLLLAALDGGRWFAEKNPDNGFIVPFLARTFPDARFVHIVRDGRDAARSHAEQPWLAAGSAGTGRRGRGGQLWGPHPRWWVEPERREEFPLVSDIARSAWCWRRFTEAALDGLAGLPDGRVLEVRYETMVAEPEPTVVSLTEFLGLGEAGRAELRRALGEARPDSVGRWRELPAEQLADIEREAGELLTRLGYHD